MNKRKDILFRIYIAFIAVCIFGLAIVGKSFKTQTVEGEYWRSLADSLTIFYKTIEAERGNIYSDNGDLLATSVPVFEIRMDFLSEAMTDEIFNSHVDSLSILMAHKFGKKSASDYKKELIYNRKRGNRFYLLKRKVTFPELQQIKKWPFFSLGKYKSGMIILQKNQRKMPFGMLAQRTIGYVRDEGRYKVGIEGSFDQQLSGLQGQLLVQRIAGGTLIPLEDKSQSNVQAGNDIYTSIDINLQDVAESALMKTLLRHKADHGSVVLMEVKTGAIKAIANIGRNKSGYFEEKYNYAIGESTEPGSTFKLAGMIALLEDNAVDVNDSIDLERGRIRYFNRIMRDAKPHKRNNVTVRRCFELSSNTGMSKLINQHFKDRPEKFYKYLKDLRVDQSVGIELRGEPEPTLRTPDKWSGVSLPWISVGYEVQMTPLQLLTLYNAVANDGVMVKPHLVSRIQEFDQKILETETVILKNQICSEKTLRQIQSLLIGVVENGTAKNIKSNDYLIAGKTGTARIADKNKGYSNRVYQSSFVGYFPADNPMYSCVIVVNSPKSGVFYGSHVAGPVFKEIADKVYSSKLEMHPAINRDKIIASDIIPIIRKGDISMIKTIYDELGISFHGAGEYDWVKCSKKDNSVQFSEMPVDESKMPDVRGMGLKDGLFLLENLGVSVVINGNGLIKRQSLRPGTDITNGATVRLELG